MLKVFFLLVCFEVCIAVNAYSDEVLEKVNSTDLVDFQRTVNVSDKRLLLHRYRRGWGSIVLSGISTLTTATSLGLAFATTIKGGCIFYPSICSNEKEIERLGNLIIDMTSQYENEYIECKQTYFDLRTATLNNGYISYYINNTIQMVETMQEIEENLDTELELKLPTVSLININETFDQYIITVIGRLEYSLGDIKNMLTTTNPFINIAAGYLVAASISRFEKSLKKAYDMVSQEDIIGMPSWFLYDRLDEVQAKPGFKQKFKLALKALKQMFKNIGKGFRNSYESIKKWKRIKNWKGFKGKLAHSLRKPLGKLSTIKIKLSKIKNFIKKPHFRTGFAKNYKVRFSKSISIIFDIIAQFQAVQKWKNVSVEVQKARESYERYYDNLQKNLKKLRKDKGNMEMYWTDTIDIFKTITLPFKTLVLNASEYTIFSNVIGLAKLPVDTSSPLFAINFNNIHRESLVSNQLSVIAYLKEIDNDLKVIEDKMRARLLLFDKTLAQTEKEEPVDQIFDDITDFFKSSFSVTLKNYGNDLKMNDILCTVAMLRTDLSEYDFFSLEPFRPSCNLNTSTFETYRAKALLHRKSKLMQKIVIKIVNENVDESLIRLVDTVHNAYLGVSDQNIKEFGSSITENDVICVISQKFKSKQTYDYINLEPFRPDCSLVTPASFDRLMNDAKELRNLTGSIRTSINVCHDNKYCPCLSDLAIRKGVTKENVEKVLRQLDPDWQPEPAPDYCGLTGCGCKHL